jgi:hypothetical protein
VLSHQHNQRAAQIPRKYRHHNCSHHAPNDQRVPFPLPNVVKQTQWIRRGVTPPRSTRSTRSRGRSTWQRNHSRMDCGTSTHHTTPATTILVGAEATISSSRANNRVQTSFPKCIPSRASPQTGADSATRVFPMLVRESEFRLIQMSGLTCSRHMVARLAVYSSPVRTTPRSRSFAQRVRKVFVHSINLPSRLGWPRGPPQTKSERKTLHAEIPNGSDLYRRRAQGAGQGEGLRPEVSNNAGWREARGKIEARTSVSATMMSF